MADNEPHSDQHPTDDERSSRDRDSTASGDGSDDPDPGERLGELDPALESHDYPTTNTELVDAYGDYEVETQDGWQPLEELLDATDDERYERADDVRRRVLESINRK